MFIGLQKLTQPARTSQSEDVSLSVSKSEVKTKLLVTWVTSSLPHFAPTTRFPALGTGHIFFFYLGS